MPTCSRVAPAVSNKDPLYDRVIDLLDVTFPEVAPPVRHAAEICFNDGMAPHNLEGTFILFGDIYAKGGRNESARGYYTSALGSARPAAGIRASSLRCAIASTTRGASRAAQDDDPSNDPLFVGAGGGPCAYCHQEVGRMIAVPRRPRS